MFFLAALFQPDGAGKFGVESGETGVTVEHGRAPERKARHSNREPPRYAARPAATRASTTAVQPSATLRRL